MVVVRLKKAWRGLGDWAESPSSDVLDRTAYARYGSAASANMFCRALSNNSYEGWSRDSRMISLLACRITRPGRAISAKRTALSRLLTHCPPNTRRFIAELKLNASTAMAHHAALAPNSLDGSLLSRVNHICQFSVNQFCRFTSSAWPRCWAASVR